MRFLCLIVAFLYPVILHTAPHYLSAWNRLTSWLTRFKRSIGYTIKKGLDCGHTTSLEWDIRDVAYKNTALYSRIFHECGTCDVRSDWVLWEWDTHQNPQLSIIVILFQGGYNPIKVRGVKTPLKGTRILFYGRVPNSFPPVRGSNSTTTYITGTANFNSNKDNFRTLY